MKTPSSIVQDETGQWWYQPREGWRQRAVISECKTCGTEFPNYPGGNRLYCSPACWRKACRRCGAEFTPNGTAQVYCSLACKRGSATCEQCGSVFQLGKNTTGRFCSKACFYNWKVPVGSTIAFGGGYRLIKVLPETLGSRAAGNRNHWMLEHRYVMQQTLGRALGAGENVHHLNGDRADNRPENLELWKRRQPRGVRQGDYHCPGCNCPM